jgi:predicted dehydrogenase
VQKIKSVIVGYGSIGKRHASIQRELGIDVTVVTKQQIADSGVNFFATLKEALQQTSPNFVVISNETSLHLPTLKELSALNYSGKILCEKPITVSGFPMESLKNISSNILVTYNLRFHPLIQKLKSHLKDTKVLTFIAYVGQYLPDWRPGTDYSQCYSAIKELGGGVLRDLSHEIDFSNYLFGSPKLVKAFTGKLSDLKINTEDVANINWITKDGGIGLISLNYLDRKINRFVIVNTLDSTYKIDFVTNEFWINDIVQNVETNRNTTYQNMYQAFLNNQFSEFCSFEQAMEVMQIIEQSTI